MTRLTETELDAVMSAAWPLHPAQRAAFEQQVLTEWQRLPFDARGPGSLHRIIAVAQKDALRGGAMIVGSAQPLRQAARAAGRGQIDRQWRDND